MTSSDIPEVAAKAGAHALVTGGAGFIGRHLCDLLRQSGWIVHSVSRREKGAASAHRHWQLDLTDAKATQAAFRARPMPRPNGPQVTTCACSTVSTMFQPPALGRCKRRRRTTLL